MTIEHVSSQSGKVKNAGRIGNLIYVTEALNGKLNNKTWEAKKAILKAVRDQWVPRDVLEADDWSTSSITARTKALAELGRAKIWVG
jgi:Protein of unknown function (DUF1524)